MLDKSLLSHSDSGCTAKSLRGALSPVSISICLRQTYWTDPVFVFQAVVEVWETRLNFKSIAIWDEAFGHAWGRHLSVPGLIFSMLLCMSVRCVEQHFAEDILDAVIHVSQMCQNVMIEEENEERGKSSRQQPDRCSRLCSFRREILLQGFSICLTKHLYGWTSKKCQVCESFF